MKEEQKIQRIGKQIVLYGLFLFLFVPMIQNVTNLKKDIRPLDGAFDSESDIDFHLAAWFKGDYQTQKDKFLRENFGFRSDYVRMICQINYSLFNKANAAYVVIGKEDYLYETGYLDAYFGRDFIGEQCINNYVKKLKRVQDSLEKRHKLILTVFAPGKAGYYPEYIPDDYKTTPKATNYDYFIKAVKSQGANHIDFNAYFRSQKSKSAYPLYSKLGIHWSNYGAIIAYDSLLHYAESKLHVDLPDLRIREINVPDSLQSPDNDAVKGLNLIFPPGSFKMAYPTCEIKYDSLKHKKLNLLVIADSFWWYLYGTRLVDSTFYSSRFWFYNREMYPESYHSKTQVTEVDYASLIRQADIIVLLHSEMTLNRFGGGFVDMCYETICRPNLRKEKIQKIKGDIRVSPEWFGQVIQKARERNITVDSMLTIDAIYLLEQSNKKN